MSNWFPVRFVILVLISVIVLLSIYPIGELFAQGGFREIHRGNQGGYRLIVVVQPEIPVVGTVHFVLTPNDLGSSEPITNARIRVIARNSDNGIAYQARALNTSESTGNYHTNIIFKSAGTWDLYIEIITDDIGKTTFRVPLQVGENPLPAQPLGSLIWLAIVSVLGGGAFYLWYSSGRIKHGFRDGHSG